ncbi:MAG: hypothetical protein H9535_08760 [Ignavibacteria bacterium]|nr:hypothetical protein [Ignavibacteria bacterium]
MIMRFLIIAILFLFPLSLFGQWYREVDKSGSLQWTNISGPINGKISSIVKQGDTLFAAINTLGVLFSTNGGQSWERSGMTTPAEELASSGTSLTTISGRVPYISNNAGASWLPAKIDTTLGYYASVILAMNKQRGVILCNYYDYSNRFPIVSSTLFATNNGGSDWYRVGKIPTTGNAGITFIGDILVIGGGKMTDSTHIFSSADMGKTWRKCTPLPEGVIKLYAHKSILYATTHNDNSVVNPDPINLFVSLDTGKSWRRCTSPHDIVFQVPFPLPTPEQKENSSLPFNVIQGITGIPAVTFDKNGDLLIGLRNNIIYRSADTGRSWQLVNSYLWKSRAYLTHTIFATDNAIFLAGRGIHRCTYKGENFERVFAPAFNQPGWFTQCQSGLRDIAVVGLAKKIYFLIGQEGLYRSFDGVVWQPVFPKMYRWKANSDIDPLNFTNPLLYSSEFGSLDVDYCVTAIAGNDEAIVAITKSGTILRSYDRGTTWLPVRKESRLAAENALLTLQNSTFLAVTNGAAYRSTDYGTTWQEISSLKNFGISAFGKNAITAVTANNSAFFAATEREIFRSLNNGITWSKHTVSLDITNIRGIAAAKTVIYTATDKGIFRSLDNGISWLESKNGFDDNNITEILAVDNIAVAIVNNLHTFFSMDYGKNWIQTASYNSLYSSSSTTFESIKAIVTNNTSILALTKENSLYQAEIPVNVGYIYLQNYRGDTTHSRVGVAPNPTSDAASFAWMQNSTETVSIGIYDTLGKCVGGFFNHPYTSGWYRYIWDTSDMAVGVYFYRYVIGDRVYSGMIAVKR